MDAIVRIQVGDQDLAQVETLLGQHTHHPPTAPVHRRRLADHDSGLQRILDVVEAAQPARELLLEPRDVLPPWEVGLPGDDPDHLQVGWIVGIHDCLHCPLEHVIRLRVRRDHAEVRVLQRIVQAVLTLLDAEPQPVLLHVQPHPAQRDVDPTHDSDRSEHPVDVVDEDDAGNDQRTG